MFKFLCVTVYIGLTVWCTVSYLLCIVRTSSIILISILPFWNTPKLRCILIYAWQVFQVPIIVQ